MNIMSYFIIKTIFWIVIVECVLSQEVNDSLNFLTRVENCSGYIRDNDVQDVKVNDDLEITYKLFTRKNNQSEYILELNSKSVINSPFNPCVGTIFIVHGFVHGLPVYSATFDLKDVLLKQGDFNVVIVDYTKYNDDSPITYFIGAFSYYPKVGTSVANLIKILIKVTGIRPETVYLVGHSLGAHIAGWAGKQVPNIGRITGLDAAGPLYRFFPESSKLSHTDAIFVDAMHTNGAILLPFGLGTLRPFADQDYFPNGGSFQPGCVYGSSYNDTFNREYPIDSLVTKMSCSHDRTLNLFIDSVNRCESLSVYCDSYEDFLEGSCSKVTSRMGFHAKKINSLPKSATFYLQTGENPPFCAKKD